MGFRFSFSFLLCGIVAALRLLAVGWAVLCRVCDAVSFRGVRLPVVSPFSVVVKNFAVKRRMFVLVCCPVLYEDS